MKRTAATLMLLAGLGGGGCMTADQQANKGQQTTQTGGYGTVTRAKQVPTVQGPLGEPIMAVRGSMPAGGPSGVVHAGGPNMLVGNGGMIRPVNGYGPDVVTSREGCTNCSVPGVGGQMVRDYGYGVSGPYGPQMPNMPMQGILPVPGQGAPGQVAAVGALIPGMHGPGMGRPGMYTGRTSINFTGPAGMKVTWQLPDQSFNDDEKGGLTAPKEYNFLQGQVYRLRLGSILPDHPGRYFYPTLEVAPASPKTLTFLAHSSVPVTFAPDDFAQAKAGNLVVKVIYLPDPANQDFSTIVGAEEVVSTRLEPGADPVAEAQRRGTILAIIRMGNIDLENKISPPMTAPPPGFGPGFGPPPPGFMPPPGFVPPGFGPPPGKLPPPKPNPGGATAPDSLPPVGLGALPPLNPPGTATVRPPGSLPPVLPTDVPIAPISPPTAPSPKAK